MSSAGMMLAAALVALGQPQPGRVSVIVAQPPATAPQQQLATIPGLGIGAVEILANGTAEGPGAPFAFSDTEANLTALASHGLTALVTVTPHVRTTPWLPEVDEAGQAWSDRQNIFDSAFLSEWTRLHREFGAAFASDARIQRIYVAPPSYFGETEYYMGSDWSTPRWLCYGPLARARFAVWLQARYGTPEAVAAAWRTQGVRFEDFAPPMPRMAAETGRHLETAWLDLLAWRTQYLNDRMEDQIRAVAEVYPGRIGFKFSVGEYDAHQGTHAAELARRCADLGRIVLHMTNGHSIADLKYCGGLARTYGAAGWVTENDGMRYSRTELAKIALTTLLSGVDEFNFAHHVHLLNMGGLPTDTAHTLRQLSELLGRHRAKPPRHEVVFLHSHTTSWVRTPYYANRDVSHVYDRALSNGSREDVRRYDWARALAYPDVIGEPQIEDGELAGRKVVIVPNTDITVLGRAAANALLQWVASGGTLICFGNDGMGWWLGEPGTAPRVERDARWSLPQVEGAAAATSLTEEGRVFFGSPSTKQVALPVWSAQLPAGWIPLMADSDTRASIAATPLGSGRVVQFAGAVPGESPSDADAAYAHDAPAMLRALCDRLGVAFAVGVYDAEGRAVATGLALGYAGLDAATGRHLFVGGAHDGAVEALRFVTGAGIAGPSELLLIDVRSARAETVRPNAAIRVEFARPLGEIYADPTNIEAADRQHIPVVRVQFEAPAELVLTLAP